MSANVRTSSRIKARKNRKVSTEQDSASSPSTKKKKNSKDDHGSAQPTTPAPKAVVPSTITTRSPAHNTPLRSTAPTPTTPSNKSAQPPATSTATPTTSGTTSVVTVSTRSRTVSGPKEDTPSKAVITPSNQDKSSAKTSATATPAVTPAPKPAPVVPPVAPAPVATHCFKNPNFTHSGRGGTVTGKKTRTWKTLKQIIASERAQLHRPPGSTYSSIDAPPSRKPVKKYSDISGLPAKYMDPRTKLRYSNAEEFAQLRMMPQDIVTGLLALRRANIDVQ